MTLVPASSVYSLPGGVSATRAIREREGPSRDVPIIALTANAFAEDVQSCLSAGMNDFVAKPVRKRVLLAAMLRQLEGGAGNVATGAQGTGEAPAPDVTLIDAEAYAALEAEIGPEAMQEALAEFLSEARARLDALLSLTDCSDRERLRREAQRRAVAGRREPDLAMARNRIIGILEEGGLGHCRLQAEAFFQRGKEGHVALKMRQRALPAGCAGCCGASLMPFAAAS